MITINEAIAQGIAKLRRDPWAPLGHIELHLFEQDGKTVCGPWVTVRDGAVAMGALEEQKVIIIQFDMDARIWEPWVAPENAPEEWKA